jgi:preprotein translocase SecE subunit
MASATTEKKEKAMATDAIAPAASEGPNRPERRPGDKHGFFTIYKKGQGYWTRMGTALAALLLAAVTGHFVYTQMKSIPYSKDAAGNAIFIPFKVSLSVGVAVFAAIALFAWRMMNKPQNVDFLIATDSEMKKVNWTTRKELIGSTKVVIFFVLLISAILFVIDIVFGYLFHLIKVLEFGPFQ